MINNIPHVVSGMFYIMRDGIFPLFEDPRNVDGGFWTYKVSKRNANKTWLYHYNEDIKKQVCLFNGNVDFKDNLDYLAKDLVTGFIIRHVSPQNNPHMYTMCSC